MIRPKTSEKVLPVTYTEDGQPLGIGQSVDRNTPGASAESGELSVGTEASAC
jgi:hypothetical protein